jgi:hypothetical protein
MVALTFENFCQMEAKKAQVTQQLDVVLDCVNIIEKEKLISFEAPPQKPGRGSVPKYRFTKIEEVVEEILMYMVSVCICMCTRAHARAHTHTHTLTHTLTHTHVEIEDVAEETVRARTHTKCRPRIASWTSGTRPHSLIHIYMSVYMYMCLCMHMCMYSSLYVYI